MAADHGLVITDMETVGDWLAPEPVDVDARVRSVVYPTDELLDITAELGAPTVSHHVKELADAGLIHTEREGKQLICSVDPQGLAALRAALTVTS